MNGQRRGCRLGRGAVVVGICLAACSAWAGIPEPNILLFGKVFDADVNLVAEGEVVWTLSAGDSSVEITAPMSELEGTGGPYSYVIMIPLETEVPGHPVSEEALPVTVGPVEYARLAEVTGTAIALSDTFFVSRDTIGIVSRVDIGAPDPAAYHSGDTNYDKFLSLRELLRMIELYTGSATHEYHCDELGEDHYGLGPGSTECDPHSGDFETGGEWIISQEELMRMIELFTSTMEHAYCLDGSTEDGYRAGACGGDKMMAAMLPELDFTRSVEPALEADGPVWDVTITVTSNAFHDAKALGLRELLPPGWVFGGLVDGTLPSIGPAVGKMDALRFVWFPVPEADYSFTYRLLPPGAPSKNLPQIRGAGLHRVPGIPGTHISPVKSLTPAGLGGQPLGDTPGFVGSLPAKPPQYAVGGPFLPSSRPGAIRDAVASLMEAAQANQSQASAGAGPDTMLAASAPPVQPIPLPGADEELAAVPPASTALDVSSAGSAPLASTASGGGPTVPPSETQVPPVEAGAGRPDVDEASAHYDPEYHSVEGELAALNIPGPGDAPVPVAWWPALIAFALVPATRILRGRKRR